MQPQIRVGVEGGRRAVLAKCQELGAPLLISANSLWNNSRRKFGRWSGYRGFDIALDSGGFVAMRRYGGFRWSPEEYATLAAQMSPTWWAQMDYCCEPELASNPAAVATRIDRTVEHLHACRKAAQAAGASPPLIVLQGWKPADYTSGPAFEPGFQWPALVGVGSVCRRPIGGPDGVLSVVDAIDRALPPSVGLHLFGVKSGALREVLARWPSRLASVDSMAYSLAARWAACHSGEKRDYAGHLHRWYSSQREQMPAQLCFNLHP